jgi:tetratricopeptide (TPR) repeat protein
MTTEIMKAGQTSPRADNPPNWRTVLGVCLLLALGVFLIFGRTWSYGFVNFDDDSYFSGNYHVKAGLTWQGTLWAFKTDYASNWHPLTWLSLMLDAQLFGTGPAGAHLTNVILHAATAVLLFLLLNRLTGALWPSALVAAIFAIHPLRVESVAWVSERKDVLSGFFFMLTLLMYARYAQGVMRGARPAAGTESVATVPDPSPATRYPSLFYGLALLFFGLGLMSKPMLVTLPFLLLLLDYWPLNRFSQLTFDAQLFSKRLLQLTLEKLPFFVLSAASCMVTVLAQQQAIKTMDVLPSTFRLDNALISYVTYMEQMIWPENLAAYYPYHLNMPTWQIVSAGALLFFVTLCAVLTARRSPYFLTGWLWYLGMLVPAIGLVQVGGQAHADRYTYLPQIGFVLAIIWAIKDLTGSWRWRRLVLIVTSLGLIAALMACAWQQTSYWQNDELLWEHAIACTSDNYTAYNNLGFVLAAAGRNTEAIKQYQQALELNPNFSDCANNLGTVFLHQGQLDKAQDYYLQALAINPNLAETHNNLAILLTKQGKTGEAIEHYRKAIELKPSRAEFYNNLGNLLTTQGRSAEAIPLFQKALEVEPDNAKVHYNLANILFAQGQWDGAIEHYQLALKGMPDSVHAHYQLGLALERRGQVAAAMAQFQTVIELDPLHLTAKNNLAWLLATSSEASLRNGQKAVELAQQAVQLSGGLSPPILDTLAAAYAEAGRFPEAVGTARRALELSEAQSNKPLAEAIQNQLKLFEEHSAYHEKP